MIKTDIQIRFADLDALNHVNNINIQHYYDLGKMYYYRTVMGSTPTINKQSIVIVNSTSNYYAPILIEDSIEVETAVEKIGNRSITFFQRVLDKQTGVVKSDCRTILATFDATKLESIDVPKAWREGIEKHENKKF